MTAAGVRRTTVIIGFVVASGLLVLLLSVVGVRETGAVIATSNRLVLAAIFAIVVLWAVAWSRTLSIVLTILDVEHGVIDGVLLFGDILFANSVASSTYLGGEPLAAYLLTRHTGIDYETSFAAPS